jgi:hypothetical protein
MQGAQQVPAENSSVRCARGERDVCAVHAASVTCALCAWRARRVRWQARHVRWRARRVRWRARRVRWRVRRVRVVSATCAWRTRRVHVCTGREREAHDTSTSRERTTARCGHVLSTRQDVVDGLGCVRGKRDVREYREGGGGENKGRGCLHRQQDARRLSAERGGGPVLGGAEAHRRGTPRVVEHQHARDKGMGEGAYTDTAGCSALSASSSARTATRSYPSLRQGPATPATWSACAAQRAARGPRW